MFLCCLLELITSWARSEVTPQGYVADNTNLLCFADCFSSALIRAAVRFLPEDLGRKVLFSSEGNDFPR